MRHLRLADRTRLAYRVGGPEGAPAVLLADGISCEGYAWRYLWPWLTERFRVIHVQYRGHGESGVPRDMEAVTLPHLALDMVEVLDRLGAEDAVCIGHSMGVQVILEMAWRRPERVRAAIMLCGASGRVLDTFKDSDTGARMLPQIKAFTERYTGAVALALRKVMPTDLSFLVAQYTELNRDLVRREDFMPYLEHFATMPPDLFVRMLEDAAQRSTEHTLAHLTMPALVVVGDRDGFTPPHVGVRLGDQLPNAQLEVLRGGSHTAPIELPERIQELISAFIDRQGLAEPAPPAWHLDPPRLALGERFEEAAEQRETLVPAA